MLQKQRLKIIKKKPSLIKLLKGGDSLVTSFLLVSVYNPEAKQYDKGDRAIVKGD